jgi:hypothetical protein
MFRRVAAALGGLLVLFHAWLLGSQAWDGQLAEPGLLLRWLIAAGLVAALAGLHRRGVSMVWGRKAVAIWLLAALLHSPALTSSADQHASPARPETVTALVQIAAASVALGLGLLLVAALIGRLPARAPTLAGLAPARAGHASDASRVVRFAPRPPPSRLSLVFA